MSKQKRIAIKASKKSISSMILSILMLLSVIPLHSSTIYADGSRKAIMNGTGNISKKDVIYFGVGNDNIESHKGEPIQWRVLDNTDKKRLFLLSKTLMGGDSTGDIEFNSLGTTNEWQGSDAQKWCRSFIGEENQFNIESLIGQEPKAILPTTKNDSSYGEFLSADNILNGDKVFFLSAEEAEKYFTEDEDRKANYGQDKKALSGWWLRSPHNAKFDKNCGIVETSGKISYNRVHGTQLVRPAFNLDTTKVLFTSPAVDGKQSNAVGKDALKDVEGTNTTEWKLTLKDDSRKKFKLDTDGIERRDLTLTIPYKDATTGTNEYISAVVEKNGTITHYGNVLQVSAGKESGTVTVQLPADFDKKTDTLYLINEQLNGEKKTDYSSAKIEIAWQYNIKLEDALKNKLTAAKGEEVRVTAIRKENKVFDKWKTEGITLTPEQETTSPLTFTMPDNDVKFIATFKNPSPTEYSVTVNGGTAQPDTAKKDEKVTVTATIPGGKAFDKWTAVGIDLTDEQEKQNPLTFDMPENNVTFTATFKNPSPTEYSVTVNGGTAQPDTAKKDEKVTVTATIPGGKAFDKWTAVGIDLTDEQEKQNPLTFDMPENNVTFTANFKKKSSEGSSHDAEYYNITTKTDKHGTVEARSKAKEGTEVSVTVSPDKGYKLDEITVTDRRGRDIKIKETNRENRYKFTMPARDVTVEATFKQIKQEQPSKPTTPPTIPPTNNNKPIENNIIKKQQTTVFTIGSNIMTVITDGKATQTTIDAKPFLSQGRVMIPVRYAAESLGMQVEWNKQTQTVVLKDRENTVMIPIKTNKIIVGNQEYTSDVTPILKNGRTYLTISNIAKALRMRAGQDVKWDNKIKQVTIIKEVEVR
ncbi:InlB B-repeat-containing protein [Filifactor alocis]|uniref:InlB B-repeat-containing protein n=1 Tax=Filifactor alocis TaxID=143361 RepID=UPI0028D6733B|nr:stalk domain-containing protein [Filifactor alocis]